ncbi:eukaryotic translation initiation factor 4 gamma 2 [Bombyx mandarina]|uniref:Eukaryotic translation initiation factor 4 gamma 2 n=2 Tax=Bombyx TaxID=7090 RepID=A0A8R2HQR7_BOMMO|nr:eukaryotic translation initiation factor 4 gamma 2 isoform X1 [Bombyx mori]XP_028027352.1 eukaryotic translation initiation factor 4 gamma 2 [Bombyx mandarina]XP_037870930.1 eukaryotic translation initiation factor 4 gamma 2 isoform X1 [Bombyx mori]
MYAQLCKRLSEEAPNFEPPGQPCTFKLLLLNKCRTEFENRTQAFAAFEDKTLSPEEEEKRHLAKCKMLGNIKFIGELGKLEILSESILHRCIQNLLARRAAAEHQEDLECLAQLVRTCGRVLDSERGRGLMEQYFARIETLSQSKELAPRIRFMLRDVAELRRGGWVPRAAAAGEAPVPMAQLRDEELPRREPLFRRARPLDEVLAQLHLPGAAPDALAFRRSSHLHLSTPHKTPPPAAHKESRPKARPALHTHLADLQMRPAANSLMFTANKLSKPAGPQHHAPLPPVPQNALSPSFVSSAPRYKEPAITIKPAPDKKEKPKKDKGVSKEEACKLAAEAVEAVAADGEDGELGLAALRRLDDVPEKVLRRALAGALEAALCAEPGRELAAVLVVRRARRAPHSDALRALLPQHHPRLPLLLAHALTQKLVTLSEIGSWCESEQHHPLLLEVLQEVRELVGLERLRQLCAESKLNLCAHAGVGADGALEALEARGLAGLVPQLQVRAALARQLAAEPAPQPLYRWIKANVEAAVRHTGGFVSALVGLLAEHVTAGADSAAAAPDKAALEREKALLEPYAPLLRALLDARLDLQLAAVYAVQVHAHAHHYPKGMLLRWFMYLYNMEVCEEEAFLRWREDVTDAYPGKGEALFQVNTWLTWLQAQESEEEEADE